ncbi:MAG: ester cyclase [Verrucomicrobiales bacterium]
MNTSPAPVEIVREWFEQLWNQRNEEVIHRYLAPQVSGTMEPGLRVENPEQFLALYRTMIETFPDIHVTVEDATGCDRHACVRWTATATHLAGGLGFPATGMPVDFHGMSWFTFENGKIVAGWDSWNQGALVTRLLAAPPLTD